MPSLVADGGERDPGRGEERLRKWWFAGVRAARRETARERLGQWREIQARGV